MPPEGPPSLVRITIRRAVTSGRFYLVYGVIVSLVLAASLSVASGSSFASAFPLLLPIFAVVGSMGALVVFTNDRLKGVLEYLLAYGATPRRIFLDVLLTVLLLVSVILVAAVGGGLALYLARHHGIPVVLALDLALYAVPMSYVSAAFAATVGMFWTSLSSPRAGMTSPLGLVPFIGILPSLGTLGLLAALGLEGRASPASFAIAGEGMVALVAAVVAVLVGSMDRFLRRERLLSPA